MIGDGISINSQVVMNLFPQLNIVVFIREMRWNGFHVLQLTFDFLIQAFASLHFMLQAYVSTLWEVDKQDLIDRALNSLT